MTTNLLSYLSHMAFSIHIQHHQGEAGFMASPGHVERLHLHKQRLGYSSSAAQLQGDAEGKDPVSLSTCHYIPEKVWHFAVAESVIAEKLAWRPCQGYRQLNTPCLPPLDSLSLQVCSPSSKASVWLSFADVGLLTIPLSSLPPFVVLRIPSNLSRSFLAIRDAVTQCRTPGYTGKTPLRLRSLASQVLSTAGL